MKKGHISILGCGWLGLPLAEHLLNKGFTIKGSTTSKEKIALLKSKNITPFVFTLGEEGNNTLYSNFLEDSEILIINFPPKRISNIETIYKKQLQSILPFVNETQKIIFISSTSVYQNTNEWVTETLKLKPEKPSGKAILAAEKLLAKKFKNNTTILRFAGLIGKNRYPGKFLAGKKGLTNAKAPVNIIHQTDCIRLIFEIINKKCFGEIINGCADEHPNREEYYTKAALKIGLTPPVFLKAPVLGFKKISNAKSKTLLLFKYRFPSPLKLL